jgi:hypothetical protein
VIFVSKVNFSGLPAHLQSYRLQAVVIDLKRFLMGFSPHSKWLNRTATELYVYRDELENISDQLLDTYRDEIDSSFIDTLPFVKRQINRIKKKIIRVGKTEEPREEVEQNLESIRESIVKTRLITLFNINKYRDIIFRMFAGLFGESGYDEIVTEAEQAAIARCQVLAHLLLLLKDAEIQSLDGSWFK